MAPAPASPTIWADVPVAGHPHNRTIVTTVPPPVLTDLHANRFTIVVIALWLVLAVVFVGQMLRIVMYHHRLRSFQAGFTILSIAWSLLRLFFFCRFFMDAHRWPNILLRIFYWTPVWLGFCTFTLLIFFFASLVHRSWERGGRRLAVMASLFFTGVLLVLEVVWLALAGNAPSVSEDMRQWRTWINAVTFLLLAILNTVYSYLLLKKLQDSFLVIPVQLPKGVTRMQLYVLLAIMELVFVSRFVTDVVADVNESTSGRFGIENANLDLASLWELICWEVLPLATIAYLFRRIPTNRHAQGHGEENAPLMVNQTGQYSTHVFNDDDDDDDDDDDANGVFSDSFDSRS